MPAMSLHAGADATGHQHMTISRICPSVSRSSAASLLLHERSIATCGREPTSPRFLSSTVGHPGEPPSSTRSYGVSDGCAGQLRVVCELPVARDGDQPHRGRGPGASSYATLAQRRQAAPPLARPRLLVDADGEAQLERLARRRGIAASAPAFGEGRRRAIDGGRTRTGAGARGRIGTATSSLTMCSWARRPAGDRLRPKRACRHTRKRSASRERDSGVHGARASDVQINRQNTTGLLQDADADAFATK